MIIVNYVGSEPQRERPRSQLTGLTGLAIFTRFEAHLMIHVGLPRFLPFCSRNSSLFISEKVELNEYNYVLRNRTYDRSVCTCFYGGTQYLPRDPMSQGRFVRRYCFSRECKSI